MSRAYAVVALSFLASCGYFPFELKPDDSGMDTGAPEPDTSEWSTTSPTETYVDFGDVLLSQILIPGCHGDATQWMYAAETQGWTDGRNLVNAWETAVPNGAAMWNEEHDLPSVDFDPNGAWDYLELVLTDEAAFPDYEQNVNTLYACGIHDAGASNTYAIRMYDIDGNYADCAIVDDDGPGNDGAAEVLADPTAGVGDEVTEPSEINATDCMVW